MSDLCAAAVCVPASTSNLGPGFDTLGLALDRSLRARFEPGEPGERGESGDVGEPGAAGEPGEAGGGGLELVRTGTLTDLGAPTADLTLGTFREAFGPGTAPAGRLIVDSDIPVARGLGSSAAARVAGRWLARLVRGGGPPDADERQALLEHCAALEGHPDNVAPAVLGGFVAARLERGRVLATHLPLSPDVGLVFADPGVPLGTRVARAALPRLVPHHDAAATAGAVALLLHGLAIADAALIRAGVEDRLHVPYRLPLIDGAAEARAAALDAGAWGVTLSGSGSGLLAFTARGEERVVADALVAGFTAAGSPLATAFVVRPDPFGARAD